MRSLRAAEAVGCAPLLMWASWWSQNSLDQVGLPMEVSAGKEQWPWEPPTRLNVLLHKHKQVDLRCTETVPWSWVRVLQDRPLYYPSFDNKNSYHLLAANQQQVSFPALRDFYYSGLRKVQQCLIQDGGRKLNGKARAICAAMGKMETCLAVRIAHCLTSEDLLTLGIFPATLLQKVMWAYQLLDEKKGKGKWTDDLGAAVVAAFMNDFDHVFAEASTKALHSVGDSKPDPNTYVGPHQLTKPALDYSPHSIDRFKSEIPPPDFHKVLPILRNWLNQIGDKWTDRVENVDATGKPLITNIDLSSLPSLHYIYNDTLLVAVMMVQTAIQGITGMLSQQGSPKYAPHLIPRVSVVMAEAIYNEPYENVRASRRLPIIMEESESARSSGASRPQQHNMCARFDDEHWLDRNTRRLIKHCDKAVDALDVLRERYLQTGIMETTKVTDILNKLYHKSKAITASQRREDARLQKAYSGRKAAHIKRQKSKFRSMPFQEPEPERLPVVDIWAMEPRTLPCKPVFLLDWSQA